MRPTRRIIVFALLPLALAAQSLHPEKIKAIEQRITTEMSRSSMPGVTVAIGFAGQVQWSAGFGMADLENQVPATASTRIRLGSISKPITAVAVLQLAEQGRIQLDAPIRQYVPHFPDKPWPVTVRQLLSHLGGVRHYKPGEIDSVRYYTDRVQPLEIFANDPLIHQPGTKYSYTTYGYNLLGAAVELVSGQPFTAYLKQNILTRAGMESTGPDDSFALIPHRSRGYSLASNGELRNCRLADTSNKIPGGGLIGTAADLVRFALAVQANQLLRAETVRSMFQRAALNDGSRVDYGMGWRIATDEGRDQVGHSGGQQGTSTMLLLYPKEGAAVAVMVNRDQAPAGTLANALARLLFQP